MNFLITTYIYPLAKPVLLSAHLGFQFDNPRTEDEISRVKHYLSRAYESGEDYGLPIYSDEPIVTLEDTLFKFRDSFAGEDTYLKDQFESYDREEILKFVAKLWIIVRYDDQGEAQMLWEEHKRMREEGQGGVFILDDDHPIIEIEQKVSDYSYLLSLLTNSEGNDYHGRGFIISDPEPTKTQDKSMWFQLLMLAMLSRRDEDGKNRFEDDSLSWTFFPYLLNDLRKTTHLLDKAFEEGLTEKFLYVGSLLRLASENRDEKVMLVILTSIIELLLTHSPDYNRFNVEESISRQFRLKASILVYLNDRSRDINLIRNRLKTIYAQRSNIAHGNFGAIRKYVDNLSKKEGEEEYFDDLITDSYLYIRAILEEYMKDNDLVEFLKNN